ncbi:MAG: hydroxymethylglutaryl-CoA synthase [Lentisphaeria bacterium]|nr:hydroxymethylglutaryl-CoA synthase [Lentisphaeria bacterium]
MQVGIDRIHYYTSNYYIDLADIAKARGVDPRKFGEGIGQTQMSVQPPGEDIVTLAANAAQHILNEKNRSKISMVILGTESGIDQSKAASIYIRSLLGLRNHCRAFEVKQACYGGTAGLQMAISHVKCNPTEQVLVLASDIARYGLGSPGEATQGGGAVAFTVSANPAILAMDEWNGYYNEDVMDFWRPNYRNEALVDGKSSVKIYIRSMLESWKIYKEKSKLSFNDFTRFCYHLPFSRMGETALSKLAKAEGFRLKAEDVANLLGPALKYNQVTGNTYAASLYVGLCSLLDHDCSDLSCKRIGLFSYGSGCMAEFFSGVVQKDYQNYLYTTLHQERLAARQKIDINLYEAFYNFEYNKEGSSQRIDENYMTGNFKLVEMKDHQRIYKAL